MRKHIESDILQHHKTENKKGQNIGQIIIIIIIFKLSLRRYVEFMQHFGKRKLSLGYDINFLNNCTINAWREKHTHTNTRKKK